MAPTLLALLAAALLVPDAAASEQARAGADRGCIESPHEPLRVRRLPGTAVSSDRPRDPLQDTQIHCDDEHDQPRASRGPGEFLR